MIRRDPIVEEVRKHRAAIAREHGNDIETILTALEQEPDDTPTVALPAKRLATRVRQRKPRSTRRPNTYQPSPRQGRRSSPSGRARKSKRNR